MMLGLGFGSQFKSLISSLVVKITGSSLFSVRELLSQAVSSLRYQAEELNEPLKNANQLVAKPKSYLLSEGRTS